MTRMEANVEVGMVSRKGAKAQRAEENFMRRVKALVGGLLEKICDRAR